MNPEQLKRYYRDRSERLYWVKRGMFQDLEDEKEEYPKEVLSYPEPEWSKNQWYIVQQIKAEQIHNRKQSAEMMTALDKLTPKKGVKSPDPF